MSAPRIGMSAPPAMVPIVTGLVINTFAGAGGWEQGLQQARHTGPVIGVEWNLDAAATARAAGHDVVLGDVAALDPHTVTNGEPLDGFTSSPPCPTFSKAGKHQGLADPRGLLIRQPKRWIEQLQPRWFVCENADTDPVLWHWRALAHHARGWGYSCWYGVLDASWYGVPQTRKRAIIIGRRDGIPAIPPEGERDTPTSMADALGWGGPGVWQRSNYSNGGQGRGYREMTRPAFTLTSKCTSNRWEWADGSSRNWTLKEAAILQSFPADYPWQGGAGARKLQVGNAVPPSMAAAVVTPLLSGARSVVPAS